MKRLGLFVIVFLVGTVVVFMALTYLHYKREMNGASYAKLITITKEIIS